MTVNAVDCTGLSPSSISNLVKNGVKTVGRYLSHSTWKGLTLGEVANIKAAGLQIFSIYESNPTKASYFSAAKGKSDALDAINLAKTVEQPENTAIYFTVDYDAQSNDLANILAYFQAIKANLHNYKVGAYGSFTVLNFLHEHNAADYYFQTMAWSGGQRCNFLNIYQSQCDTKFAGVSVDIDELLTNDIGAWGQPVPVTPPVQPKPVQQPTPSPQPTPAPIKHQSDTPAKPVTPPPPPKPVGKWVKENSQWFYYENGKKRVGWLNDGGKWYYLDENSASMCVGWKKVADFWYFFDIHGVLEVNSWITDKGKKYWVNSKGQMVTGTQTIDGKIYNFNSHGELIQ